MKYKNCLLLFLIIIFILIIFIITDRLQDIHTDNIIYIPNFLNKGDFYLLKSILQYEKYDMINESFRLIKVINNMEVSNILYSDQYIKKIESRIKNKIFKSNFPIEYRIYPTNSPGMNWHKDLILYDKPQYEAILTIDNNSNSETKWIDNNNKINTIHTEPNSILLVKAKGYIHSVTPITNNKPRSILKYIYTQSNNINNNYRNELKRFT